MATKTISLELDAYDKLRRAKQSPRESFSAVVRRGQWDNGCSSGPETLAFLRELASRHPDCLLADSELRRIRARVRSRSARERHLDR